MSNNNSEFPAAGSSTWGFVLRYHGWRILAGLVGLAFLGLMSFYTYQMFRQMPTVSPLVRLVSLLVVAASGVVIWRLVNHAMDWLFHRESQARRGAVAEETVGAILVRLPEGDYSILHDVRTRHGNIDHVIFRRDGAIFLIETKSHRGKISERGEHLYRDGGLFEKDIIKQTLANIYDLRSMLAVHLDQPPWISATIVFTNALVPRVCRIKNIEVLHLSALESWMSKARGQMPADALWSQRDRLRKALS